MKDFLLTVLVASAIWFVVSVVVGLLLGRFMAVGKGCGPRH